MKRYVLLIFGIILFFMFRNNWVNHNQRSAIVKLQGQVDSLVNVTLSQESLLKLQRENLNKINVLILDTLDTRIKAYDSTIFSHDQQIRWLQWHVERLK